MWRGSLAAPLWRPTTDGGGQLTAPLRVLSGRGKEGSPVGETGKKSGRGLNGIVQQYGRNNRVAMQGTRGKNGKGERERIG